MKTKCVENKFLRKKTRKKERITIKLLIILYCSLLHIILEVVK